MAAALASTATACGSSLYLAHVGVGQLRLLLERETIDAEVVARLSPDERRALSLVEEARGYGESLGLERPESYRHLLDRGSEPLITLVVAAPPDRIEAVTWWFPIVGRVPYRGYFDAERAHAFADGLEERGLHTHVRPALLYSTLGWFDDPIPRALLRYREYDIVDVFLHEQVHETVFVPGDIDYNEALASFVATRATLLFFEDRPEARARAERAFADRARFADLVAHLSSELERLYAEVTDPDEIRNQRQAIVRRYQREVFQAIDWQTSRYAAFPEEEVDNAYLVAQRTYLGDLPCFEAELARLGGDLRSFIRRHRSRPGREGCGPESEP